jgi:signal transduction histidine kinase
VVIALGLAIYFNRSTINRLRTLMDNTMRITAKKELNVPVGGHDEIKQLDTFIRDMAQALQESARFKQEVISMVSHDLRSPLTSIQITVQSLMSGVKGDLPADALDAIEGVERNTSRLIKLINNLLDSEKLEAGELELRKQEISLQLVASNAVEALTSYARAKSIEVDDSECDIDVVADGDRLEQVVTNFLSNAIKFSPAHSKIVLRGTVQDEELLFEIIDQGPGVPTESSDAVFERFKQLSNQNGSEAIKGTGLGLSICKRMIEAHGGTVGVKPNPDGGSIFWFKIPYADSQSVAVHAGQNDHAR